MPRATTTAKTVVKKPVKRIRTASSATAENNPEEYSLAEQVSRPSIFQKTSVLKNSRNLLLILILLAVLALIYYKKGWFVAATVNGTLISNLELQTHLNDYYRSKALNQMIEDKIIYDEAKKKGIVVLNSEIQDRISEIEKNVGGPESLSAMLSQQEITQANFEDRIKVNLVLEKLYAKEVSVSAEEIQQFLSANKEMLSSSDSAQQEKEATEALRQQKLQQVVSEKFRQLKDQSSVKTF